MKAVHIFPIGGGPDKGSLSYFTAKEVFVGDTVSITIRGRKVLGIVDEVDDIEEDRTSIKQSAFKLKKIDAVLGQTIHGGVLYKTAKILARYYISHPGHILSAITPVIFSDPILKDIRRINKITDTEKSSRLLPLLIQTSKVDRVIYFKKLIREYFAKKESVAIILPTISEAKEWRELLSKGITEHTIFFTGEENKKNQKEMVRKASDSAHSLLLIGTLSAAILPVKKLGAIIVEHESSGLYNTRKKPFIDKRIVAEVFAHICNIPCYFSDSLLELKTSGRIQLGTATAVEKLNFRIPGKSSEIIDLTIKKTDGEIFRAISKPALKEIRESIENNEQIFIFSFRKNYASNTVCKDCGEGVTCLKCEHALALLSQNERTFYCSHCNENKRTNIVCGRCNSWNLVPLGVGIDRVKEELDEAGLGDNIIQIDGRQKDSEIEMGAKQFVDRKKNILIGTEAAISRLPDGVDLVVVASIDSLFAMPIYTAPERAAHLLMRLAEISKKTIIQTRYTHETILENIKRGTFSEFSETEFSTRKSLGYPPFVRLINLSFTGQQASVEKATKKLEGMFEEYKPEFFEATDFKGHTNVRMQIKLEPELWPIVPKNENDTTEEDLYSKLASLPKAIKINIE